MKVHHNQYWCETCGMKEPLDIPEFRKHLETVHQLTGRISGSRSLRMALDFEGGYSNTFDLVLPGNIKATYVSSGETVKDQALPPLESKPKKYPAM